MEDLDSSGSFASITVDSDHNESEELMPVKLSATSTPAMTPSLCSELRISLVKLNYLADKSAKYIKVLKEQLFTSRIKLIRVPTRTGKPGKPGKMRRHFPVREKSGNFDQTGKVRENHTKYWKNEKISDKYYLKFSVIF